MNAHNTALPAILDRTVDIDITEVTFDVDDTEWHANYDTKSIQITSGSLTLTIDCSDPDDWVAVAKSLVRGISWALNTWREE
jgi:hypothetical protein